jgi:hypothetical protein
MSIIYPKLKAATPLTGYKLLLDFGGEKRVYDFRPNLTHSYYKELADPVLFRKVSVNDGEIEWATGQDFCPHTLYEESKPSE